LVPFIAYFYFICVLYWNPLRCNYFCLLLNSSQTIIENLKILELDTARIIKMNNTNLHKLIETCNVYNVVIKWYWIEMRWKKGRLKNIYNYSFYFLTYIRSSRHSFRKLREIYTFRISFNNSLNLSIRIWI